MGAKRFSDTVYFEHKYITNKLVTPEDDVVQSEQKLTAALKGNLQTDMDESDINQLNKLGAIFNTTAENFWQ